MKLDSKDRRILQILQLTSDVPIVDIAEAVSLSVNACWRRVQRLQKDFINHRVAILDADKLGLGLTAFVFVKTNQHNDKWLAQFSRGVAKISEVIEFYRMSGEVDYLLKVVVRDVADYDRVYKKIISAAPLSDVSSSFAMEKIKSTTALPI
jgi:Lrp/AsnC family transcriptional regulator